MNILDNIHGHNDLINLTSEQRKVLCEEIRSFLVSHISKTGGHLASNLGVVELTLAIETVFDTAVDRLVFDVGHQSYVHKLLTGRQTGFDTLRQFGGMAGFPKPSESNCDAFVAGHSSSSVSIALGMARARTQQKQDYSVLALLGDGAATGGMVYEGLNDAAVSGEPMIVILNDNAMSIDHNVGGMAFHLSKLRTKEKYLGMKQKYRTTLEKIPGGKVIFRITRKMKDIVRRMLIPATIFECMGFTYLGPVDGHDVDYLISLLRAAKNMKRPVLLHVMTQKGRGYKPAEEHPKLFHGVGKFNPETGEVPQKEVLAFSDAFGNVMCQMAESNDRLCAITAAMPGGTGLLNFKKQFSDRMYDVGIAEEHAVSMAAGLAKQGMIPVVAIYSTFLQRAYDMILQDICMLGLHVVFAVDRAGLVGEDGETHHGVFDVGFLRQAPGMTVLCPASLAELRDMMRWAVQDHNGPVAVRYPRGGELDYTGSAWNPSAMEHVVCHKKGTAATIITYGALLKNAEDAAEILTDSGLDVQVLRLPCICPLPLEQIVDKLCDTKNVFVLEDVCKSGGIACDIAYHLQMHKTGCTVHAIDLGAGYATHGSLKALHKNYGLDAGSIANRIREVLACED